MSGGSIYYLGVTILVGAVSFPILYGNYGLTAAIFGTPILGTLASFMAAIILYVLRSDKP